MKTNRLILLNKVAAIFKFAPCISDKQQHILLVVRAPRAEYAAITPTTSMLTDTINHSCNFRQILYKAPL